MWIERMEIGHFGCLRDREQAFFPGLNLLGGENGTGKTTSLVFLRAMLFGLARARGRAAGREDLRLYEPWDADGRYGGSLYFACGGKHFALHRDFFRPERGRLFCREDEEELSLPDGDLGMLLGEMPEALFANACMMRQESLRVEDNLPESLSHYLINLESLGGEEMDAQKACACLRRQCRELEEQAERLGQERRQARRGLEERIAYVQEEEKRLEGRRQALERELEGAGEAAGAGKAVPGPGAPGEGAPEDRTAGRAAGLLLGAGCVLLAAGAVLPAIPALASWLPGTAGIGCAAAGAAALLLGFLLGRTRHRAAGRRPEKAKKEEKKEERQKERQKEDALLRRQAACARRRAVEEELEEKRTLLLQLQDELCGLCEAGEEEREKQGRLRAARLAQEQIQQAAGRLTARRGGQLFAEASEILEFLTEGAYRQVRWEEGSRADLTVSDGSRRLHAWELSTAAREQVYLSVRLGAGMCLTEEPLPFLLDDPFSNWDDRRYGRALQWLEGCGRQVLLYTCRERGQAGDRAGRHP